MATNKIQDGNRITATAVSDVSSGQFVIFGALFGVAITSAKQGQEFVFEIGGAWEFELEGAIGDTVYHADGSLTLTSEDADGVAGVLIGANQVLLNSSFGDAGGGD